MSRPFRSARWLAASGVALALFTPAAAHAAKGEIGCANYDVIVTRGSAEPSGFSIALDTGGGVGSDTGVWTMISRELQNPTDGSTPIAQLTQNGSSGQVVRTDVDYPADLPWPSSSQGDVGDSEVFRRSVRLGTQRIIEYINQQYARCPNKRYVLLGYSQGAVVVGNVLTDDVSMRLWIDNAPLPSLNNLAKPNIAAVGLFADVGFNQASGWAVRSSTLLGAGAPLYLQNATDDLNRGMNDGNSSRISQVMFPRNPAAWAPYKHKIRNYCIQNDFICQGSGGFTEHLYYGDIGNPIPRKSLSSFVIQQLRNQADKTLAATCSISSASDAAQVGKTYAATLRFRATVNDRGVAGAQTSITNPTQTFSVDATNANKLRTILGGTPQVESALVQVPIKGVSTNSAGTSDAGVSKLWNSTLFTASAIPANTAWSFTTTSGATPTWTVPAGGRVDVSATSVGVFANGSNGSWARSDCSLPTANGSQSFGRIVAGA